ncbi:MAG: aspartyl protease family protein, partial [Bacteroidota bacterium]|nr:aspartyl protease family protein [Bacteroidota bacterium]
MAITIPIHLLSIEGDGFHLQVKIKINGKNANAIIDTGASKTVFDKSRIDAFLKKETLTEHDRMSTGLGTASMQSHAVLLRKLSIGKVDIAAYHGVVLDLSHVNQT